MGPNYKSGGQDSGFFEANHIAQFTDAEARKLFRKLLTDQQIKSFYSCHWRKQQRPLCCTLIYWSSSMGMKASEKF